MPQITLECAGITKTYRSTDPPTQVLHGIDLTVTEGEFVVIMGPRGRASPPCSTASAAWAAPRQGR